MGFGKRYACPHNWDFYPVYDYSHSAIGAFSIVILGILVVGFNLLRWLFVPKIIDALLDLSEDGKAADSPEGLFLYRPAKT